MDGIPNRVAPWPETIRLYRKRRVGLRPGDARFQARNRFPTIIARRIISGFPERSVVRIVKPGRSHPNDGEGFPVFANLGTENSRVACKKILLKSIADHRDCVAPGRVLPGIERSSKDRLYAKDREKIPGRHGGVRPRRVSYFR